jgi:alpha-galactosidase
MKHFTKIFLALAAFACVPAHAQKFPGLALTPPMGWNSWNKFASAVDETIVRAMADAMATNGMKDAGYQYRRTPSNFRPGSRRSRITSTRKV